MIQTNHLVRQEQRESPNQFQSQDPRKFSFEKKKQNYAKLIKHYDSKHYDSKHYDSKHYDSKHYDGKHYDSKHYDSKQNSQNDETTLNKEGVDLKLIQRKPPFNLGI
jgi:hypothetical protein